MNQEIKVTGWNDLCNLVCPSQTGGKEIIVYHTDGGHGWLQVPHELIKKSGIAKEITGYSYMDTKNAYLEEDCDMGLFIKAIGIDWQTEEGKELLKSFYSIVPERYTDHSSPIRNKDRYTAPREAVAVKPKTPVAIQVALF